MASGDQKERGMAAALILLLKVAPPTVTDTNAYWLAKASDVIDGNTGVPPLYRSLPDSRRSSASPSQMVC